MKQWNSVFLPLISSSLFFCYLHFAVKCFGMTLPWMFTLLNKVDDKYEHSCEDKDLQVHGWICMDPPTGFWQITPSDEFLLVGPSSRTSPVMLALSTLLWVYYENASLVWQTSIGWIFRENFHWSLTKKYHKFNGRKNCRGCWKIRWRCLMTSEKPNSVHNSIWKSVRLVENWLHRSKTIRTLVVILVISKCSRIHP